VTRRAKPKSVWEEMFFIDILNRGCLIPTREYRFRVGRRWAFDFAWPDQMVAVEIEGGIYNGGRHVRPTGFENDCEKYNAATLDGWRVYRFTGPQVSNGSAASLTMKALGLV
jgi:very-short-patch-repair endonuclease